MAGHPDPKKRDRVRNLLSQPRWQRASDLAVSRVAGVSRYLVADVRRELIRAGSHPPLDSAFRPCDPRPVPGYRRGGSPRGGYVYDRDGSTISEADWLAREAARVDAAAGRVVAELLARLRSGTAAVSRPRPTPRSTPGQQPRPRRRSHQPVAR